MFNALFLSLFIFTYFILLPFLSCTHGIFYSPAEFQVETYVPENCVYFENYKVNMNLFIIFSPFVTTQPNIVLPFNSSIQNFESTSNNLLLQFSLGHCYKTLCSIFGFINTERERGKWGYKWTHRHQCIYSFVLFNSLLLCSPQISIGSHCKHAGKICVHEKNDVFVLEKNWNDYKKALIWTHTHPREKKTMKKP